MKRPNFVENNEDLSFNKKNKTESEQTGTRGEMLLDEMILFLKENNLDKLFSPSSKKEEIYEYVRNSSQKECEELLMKNGTHQQIINQFLHKWNMIKEHKIDFKIYESVDVIIFGINDYHNLEQLKGATNDSSNIQKVFEEKGYTIKENRVNPTKNQAIEILEKYEKERESDIERKLLLFFFSGHVQTTDDDKNYLCFVDFDESDSEIGGIEIIQIRDMILKLKYKHNLFILDSCTSGNILSVDCNTIEMEDKIQNSFHRGFWAITAGINSKVSSEKVHHSQWRGTFSHYLERVFREQTENFLNPQGLVEEIIKRMEGDNKNNNINTPRFGYLGNDRSDLIGVPLISKMSNYTTKINFHLACRYHSNLEIIKYLFDKKSDLNLKDVEGNTPLHLACRYNKNKDIIKFLAENKSDLSSRDRDNNTPLHLTCKINNSFDILKFMLKNKGPVNLTNKDGNTPFHLACSNNINLKIVKHMLSLGADITLKNNNEDTPFHLACSSNSNPEIIKHIVSLGADLDAKNKQGNTPFHLACLYNVNPEVIEYLATVVSDFNKKNQDGNTPFHLACLSNRSIEVIKMFDNKADLTMKNNEGELPIHLACKYNNNVQTLHYLISIKSDINAKNKKGSTPFLYACGFNNNIDIIKCILSEGTVDINVQGSNGYSSFHYACLNNKNLEIIKYMVTMASDINLIEKFGNTPLHFACLNNPNLEIIKYLVSSGADFNLPNKTGNTPLHCACRNKNGFEIIKYMVSIGCNVNAENEMGQNILHSACLNQELELVKYLVSIGLDISRKNKNGITPYQLLSSNKPIHEDPSQKSSLMGKKLNRNVDTQKFMEEMMMSENYKKKAVLEYNKSDFSKALVFINKSIKMFETYESLQTRSLCHLKLNNHESAMDDSERCIDLNENRSGGYYLLAKSLYLMKLYEEAQYFFELARRLGETLHLKEISEIEREIFKRKDNKKVFMILYNDNRTKYSDFIESLNDGKDLLRLFRFEDALLKFERAISQAKFTQMKLDAMVGRVECFYDLKRYEQSISEANQVLSHQVDNERALFFRTFSHKNIGNLKEYERDFAKYKRLFLGLNIRVNNQGF